MFNIIIFLIGAGIMFYMAWRSWSRRRKLMTRGEKVEAAVAGTVQSRDGEAYLLEFTTAGGTHRLHYPKSAKGRELAQGAVVTLYYNPDYKLYTGLDMPVEEYKKYQAENQK